MVYIIYNSLVNATYKYSWYYWGMESSGGDHIFYESISNLLHTFKTI